MSSVLRDATGLVDQALAGGALAGSGALLVSLMKLVAELRGSKELFQKLIDRLQAVKPQLERMVQNDKIKVPKQILTEYETLLIRVLDSLQEHVDSNGFQRVFNHWKMKDCVIEFDARLSGIKDSLLLATIEENADRHGELDERLDQLHQVAAQTKADTSADLRALERELATRAKEFLAELGRNKDATVADFKHELKTNLAMYTKEQRDLLRKIFSLVNPIAPLPEELPGWYLPRAEYRFDERSPFSTGKFRSIYHGTLVFSGAEVTIRTVDVEAGGDKTREDFRKEVDKWTNLRDPHVLPLYGANHLNSPMVFVCGRAELGNFNDYLSTHKHRFWQVFLDAARGLAYLHKQKICHGNLKCNNLLVTKHGVGVLSDFLFSFVRTNSALSLKEQTPDHFWKAPECYTPPQPLLAPSEQLKQSPGTNPRVQSDVYSLGMCIYEAMSGTVPYAEMDEEVAIDRIRRGELPPRPSGKITDEAWSLIKKLCCRDFQDRIRLDSAIDEMRVLVDEEKLASSHVPCRCTTKVCLACGGHRHFETSKSVPYALPAPAAS